MADTKTCCICNREFTGWGNNPWPVKLDENAICCDDCNYAFVIPARLADIRRGLDDKNVSRS